MSDSQPNYREAYFQHPLLTKISGDLTYKSLAKLEKKIKANRKSMSSTLEGGSQGHLGLVSNSYMKRLRPHLPQRPLHPAGPTNPPRLEYLNRPKNRGSPRTLNQDHGGVQDV